MHRWIFIGKHRTLSGFQLRLHHSTFAVQTGSFAELSAFKLTYMVLWTFFQHETAVAGWYSLLTPYFDHWLSCAATVLVVVSIIDIIWLWMWFFANKKIIAVLMSVEKVRDSLNRLSVKPWLKPLTRHFAAPPADHESNAVLDIQPTDSPFRKMVKKSGHLGIILMASLPGPGLKELGILMALTPKYRRHGFLLMYIGGIIKTIGTLAVYGGLYQIFEKFIIKSV